MIERSEFEKLSGDLRRLATSIPIHWGAVQCNSIDNQIDMFNIHSVEALERLLKGKSDYVKNYLKRRWYLWKCSICDEFLFCHSGKAKQNPNPYDKSWDIELGNNPQLRFDIKGTVIPRDLRNDADAIIANPTPMIEFFYERQSTGRRYDMQNRLFIVHHSFVDENRELYLRCAWRTKERLYDTYADKVISGKKLYEYKGCTADTIFIIEREKNKLECLF